MAEIPDIKLLQEYAAGRSWMKLNPDPKNMRVKLLRTFLVLCLAVLAIGCNRSKEFPPLENGEALRADCARLINAYPEGEISSNGWPRSVKELKPIRVVRETNAVRIFVKAPEGFRGGYWVSPNTQSAPSVRNTWIQKTEHKGIYQFRTY